MSKIRMAYWRIAWALLALVALSGCGPLKGIGSGLGNMFKGFKLP